MLARPARRATYHRARRSGELIPQNERELRRSEGSGTITELWGAEKLGRSEGSGMLIGDPLVEGSSASSTDGELWRAENSFLGMRGTQLPMRSSRAENSLLRVRPITSSGEWRTHSSEWEGTPPLLSRKFPPNLGQVKFTVVTGELERNERACLSLTRAFLSP